MGPGWIKTRGHRAGMRRRRVAQASFDVHMYTKEYLSIYMNCNADVVIFRCISFVSLPKLDASSNGNMSRDMVRIVNNRMRKKVST